MSQILDKSNMLAMPDGLTTRGKRAYQLIVEHLQQHDVTSDSTGGCRAFYTPKEWHARGNEYGNGVGSVLIVVYDGGALRPYFNMDACSGLGIGSYVRYENMQNELAKLNFYFEECTGCYAAIYDRQYKDGKPVTNPVTKQAVTSTKRDAKALVKADANHSPYLVGVSWKKLLTGLVGKRVKITIEEE